MFKKMLIAGVLFVTAVATVLVTPDTGQAQRYFAGGYGVYQPYYYRQYGYSRPYYTHRRYYRPYYGGYYGHPRYYSAYPRYSYYPGYYHWR
jgi:hypothetical protein